MTPRISGTLPIERRSPPESISCIERTGKRSFPIFGLHLSRPVPILYLRARTRASACPSSGLRTARPGRFSTWVQIIVVETSLCPSSSCTVRMSGPTLDRIRFREVWSGHPLPVPPAKRLFRARRKVWKGTPRHPRGMPGEGTRQKGRRRITFYTAWSTTIATPHCLRMEYYGPGWMPAPARSV